MWEDHPTPFSRTFTKLVGVLDTIVVASSSFVKKNKPVQGFIQYTATTLKYIYIYPHQPRAERYEI